MKRRKLLLVAVGAVLLIGAVMIWTDLRRPRFTMDQIDRIQVGMTVEEASAILGCQPGDHTDDPDFYGRMQTTPLYRPWLDRSGLLATWAADCGRPFTSTLGRTRHPAHLVQVRLGDDGRIAEVYSVDSFYAPRTLLEQVRWWTGWVMARLKL